MGEDRNWRDFWRLLGARAKLAEQTAAWPQALLPLVGSMQQQNHSGVGGLGREKSSDLSQRGVYRPQFAKKRMIEEPKPSIEQLQQRINQNPADTKAYSLLGNALSHGGLWAEAISAWQQALRLDPEDDHAQFCICLLINGDEPIVEPTAELLKFLTEYTDGHYLKLGQAQGAVPPVTDSEQPAN